LGFGLGLGFGVGAGAGAGVGVEVGVGVGVGAGVRVGVRVRGRNLPSGSLVALAPHGLSNSRSSTTNSTSCERVSAEVKGVW
jgi:hypothetical protein